jgi:protein-tyrosine-phosphatase
VVSVKEILFVCSGNRLRSLVAEHVFRSLLFRVDQNLFREVNISSAGVIPSECYECTKRRGLVLPQPLFGKPPARSAVTAMAKRGIDISAYRTRELDIAMVEASALILTAVKAHKRGVLELCPASEGKVFTLMEFTGERLYYLFDDCHTIAPELHYQPDFGDDVVTTEALIAETEYSLNKTMPKILDYLRA